MTVEGGLERKHPKWFARGDGGSGAFSMTVAGTYRRFAAECVGMAQRRENASDKAQLLQMATMWLKLA